MATEVFNLDIQINSQPAETALKRLQSQFDQTKKKADAIGSGANTGLKNYTTSVKAATGVTQLFAKALGLLALGTMATDTIRAIAGLETLSESLKVVTGSAQGAAAALDLIKKIGLSSAFSVNEIGKAFINLKANGVEPTESLLRTFADTAAITTDRLGALNAMSNLFARNVEGGLNLVDLNTLANQGIPVFKILTETLGITRGEIANLGRTAEGAKLILDALKSGLDKQFAGASIQQAKTLAGQFDILKENLTEIALAFGGGGFSSVLKDVLKSLNELTPALKSIAASLGGQLGDSINGIGTAMIGVGKAAKFVYDNLLLIGGIIATIGIAVFLPEILAVVAGFRALYIGSGVLIENFAVLTAGLTRGKAAWVVFTEVIASFLNVFRPLLLSLKENVVISFITKTSSSILAAIPAWIKWGLAILGVGKAVDSLFSKSPKDQGTLERLGITPSAAGAGRGDGQAELSARTIRNSEQEAAARKRAQDLALGRSESIRKIVDALKEEAKQIGINKIEIESRNKIFEVEAQIKDKLIAAGKEQEAQAFRLNATESGAIRNAVAAKYSLIIKETIKDQQFELSLVGKTTLEAEKLRAIREIELEYGKKGLGIDKERAEVIANIVRLQEAQVNSRIQDSFAGIRNEIDLLKLSNAEREKAISLDQIAQDAGFRNRADFTLNRPAAAQQAGNLIDERTRAQVAANGRDQVQNLQDQLALLRIVDDKERERVSTLQEIYKQIDPDGRGKNITDAQKEQIKGLEAQIEAQNALVEINRKIQDSFTSLGDAVTKSLLGGTDAVKILKLELIKLAALQAFKYFAGGLPTGTAGSFFTGLLQGLGGGRANGGPVKAGVPYRVGEKGPETVVFPQSGRVIPNSAMMNSRTGSVSNVTFSPNLIIQGSVTGQSELDRAFEEFAGAMASETEKLIIRQAGTGGFLRAR